MVLRKGGAVLALSALLWWLLTLFLAGWWLTRTFVTVAAETEAASVPPDPIVELVDKWAHDWERGRA